MGYRYDPRSIKSAGSGSCNLLSRAALYYCEYRPFCKSLTMGAPLTTVEDITTAARDLNTEVDQNDVEKRSADVLDSGTIEAFGYSPVYRRVVGALVGFCIVISLTS
jgi:hypothetical protein